MKAKFFWFSFILVCMFGVIPLVLSLLADKIFRKPTGYYADQMLKGLNRYEGYMLNYASLGLEYDDGIWIEKS